MRLDNDSGANCGMMSPGATATGRSAISGGLHGSTGSHVRWPKERARERDREMILTGATYRRSK